MAADGRMRCRRRRMQGRGKMTSTSGAEQMKPHGGIRGHVKSGDGNGKSGDRGIETHGGASGSVGQIIKRGAIESEIKPSSPESEIKPSSPDSDEDAWIYVRGCRIKRDGLRFNSQGDVYVPDSEEDESIVERGADGTAAVELVRAMAVDGVATEGATSVEMNPEVAAHLAKKVLGEDLHPEVAALLAEVLSKIEPVYHEFFISMYKEY